MVRALRASFAAAIVAATISGAWQEARAQWPPGVEQTESNSRALSTRHLREVEERIAAATRILARIESEAKARRLGPQWRQASLETLLPLSAAALREVEQQAFSLETLSTALGAAADDPRLLGEPDADLVYIPIAPCRFIDTRFYAEGKVGGAREFDVDLTGASYGGSGACNLPSLTGTSGGAIAAAAMNVTVVDTSGTPAPGFVALKPTVTAPTTSLANWYDQGTSVQIANQGIVTLDQDPATPPEFVIQTSGPVHVIVDLFGAFAAPQSTPLDVQTLERIVSHPAQSSIQDVSPQCPTNFRRTGGGCAAAAGTVIYASRPGDTAGYWFCGAVNQTNFASLLRIFVICARTPGR